MEESESWKSNRRDPLVSIIVVTYNGHDVVAECLESIKALVGPIVKSSLSTTPLRMIHWSRFRR